MADKRILLVTFYYPPDLSAGSFRVAALVEALLQQTSPRVSVDVVTTQPNRYSSFSAPALAREDDGRLTVRRITLPPHQSGMVDQAKAFRHFARGAAAFARERNYDLVLATSGRLMTAALGAWIATRRRTPLYLDIRDIFADGIQYIVPKILARPLRWSFSRLERWTVNHAARVNLVSRGFESYFRARYPQHSLSFFTNGVDDGFCLAPALTQSVERVPTEPVRVLYAGNVGEAQGLHMVLPALALRLGAGVRFKIIGDGGRRRLLEQLVADMGLTNIEIVPPMSRDSLIGEYRSADVLFLHLNDYDAFKKVLPSKIFEYAALGKPIWAGVAGYAAAFIREEVTNAAVFPPCDVEAALESFHQLEMRDAPRSAFVQRYSRRVIMRAMAADIVSYAAAENRT